MVYHYVRRELLLQNYVDRLANESSDESVEIDEELDYLFLEEYILKLLEEPASSAPGSFYALLEIRVELS
ncbi:hypothetical protein NXW94_02585 [Bacteroides ovatus]|nr:hypothetical protein [Bacteroides ovatus]